MRPRKIATTFTVELDQLERLTEVAARARLNRSMIVREAIDIALERYEKRFPAEKVVESEVVEWGGGAVEALAKRP